MSRKNKQLNKLQKAMDGALSYDAWAAAASEYDDISGLRRWRDVDQTSLYDYAQIRLRVDRLRSLRARQDYSGLLFTLNEGIHGNMGGMGRSSLYNRAKFGTKRLIEEYVDEIDHALRFLAELETPEITIEEKLDFFYRANICFGRSALMLSGGGVLGFYHMGVVKILAEQKLLPRVISGSSAGSLVAGVLGTHSDDELEEVFDPGNMIFEAEKEASVFSRLFRGGNATLDVRELENIIAGLVPDMTFQEAYERTGRQISITVAPAEPHQRSRLLNAITSPNVYIRSAVMASCAVPGVFPPVMLMAKNAHGEAQPYLPSRRWVDGSIADDLPAKRLSRLYSTNHYIVSMVNPIAIPFLHNQQEETRLSGLRSAMGSLGVGVGREVLNFYRGIVQKDGENWPRFNMLMNSIHGLMDQEYSGDVNIVPSFRWFNPTRLLSHLNENELLALVAAGERSAYPHIKTINICTRISRTLDEILHRFEYGDLHPDLDIRRPSASRRRPLATRADRSALREGGPGAKDQKVTSAGRAKPARKATRAKKPAASKAKKPSSRKAAGNKKAA